MRIVQASRASAILYGLLLGRDRTRPWLLPANICPIVPITFFKAGVPIEFVDIAPDTLHIDLDRVERRLRRGDCGGLLYAHTYGDPSTPDELFRSVRTRYPDVLVVDDRCLCDPDLDPLRDTEADAVLYSTGYAKVVELDGGGYAYLRDETPYRAVNLPYDAAAEKAVELAYKQAIRERNPYRYTDSDWLRADEQVPEWSVYREQVAAGLVASRAQRGTLNAIYAALLPDEIQLPASYQSWRFNVRVNDSARLLESIFAAGLFASSHYASLAGIMAPGDCPQAERLAGEIVNLFNDHHFDEERARRICAIIATHLG